MKVEPRFLVEEGREIFTGNELLLKGALEVEGGVHLLGGYPGSPVAGFFDSMRTIQDLLKDRGVRAVINNNEALAGAMLNGSQVVGLRGLICMKSVGVHVAADALALGSLAGAHRDGGAVVVYGDDPWSDSTQVASDSRYISKHLFIPVVEPANPQEVKDWVDLAFKLSSRSELYAGYILPNNLADGGGTVVCRPNQFPEVNTHKLKTIETAKLDMDKFVLLPPRTWWQEERIAPRFQRAIEEARNLGLNRIEHPADVRRPVGFVTSGLAHGYLTQALWEMGLHGRYPIAKLGLTYPVDPDIIRQLATQCERIVVVEERRGFLEEQIGEILLRDRQLGLPSGQAELWGKRMPGGKTGFPSTRGLHPSIVIGVLAPLLKEVDAEFTPAGGETSLDREILALDATAQADVAPLPARLPTFCPGCPHRDTASLCLDIKKRFNDADYMRRTFAREPVDVMFHGDTGCYTMLMFPPNTPLMHDYSGMGLGAGTGSGVDPFITNKQVVFMGDSTFYHSGQIAISHAIKLNQDITFVILDNSTTAMTGHQPTPGVDWDIIGENTPTQDIEDIVAGIAGTNPVSIARIDPEDREAYRRRLERTILADGVKVIIADKECGITRTRRRRRQERETTKRLGFLPAWEHMNINQEICRFCLACIEMTGCPGLRHTVTDYGRKMDTDLTYCVADGACQRIGACWSFERVTVKRKQKARTRVPELGLDDIPEPRDKIPFDDAWYCYLAGVGGMGIGLSTQILVRAGHKEGYHVSFVDKKGLAIRNGGVNSQVAFTRNGRPNTGMIPFGKADLLIGVDVLEAARSLEPGGRTRAASPDRTAAVINTDKVSTTRGSMGREDFDVEQLEATIRAHTRSDDYLARNISRICEKYLGNKIYANVMMLGFAFQKGLIPVSMHSIAWAIKDTIKADFKKNLYAFNMGRKFVEDPDLFQGPPQRTGWRETLEERCRFTRRRYLRGKSMAKGLRGLTQRTVEHVDALDENVKRDIVVRLYDCMRWAGLTYARRYADAITGLYDRDLPEKNYGTTRAAVTNLARAMLIKDAVFIAELATSPEKYARDREKYNVTPAQGDRIEYRHLLPLHLKLGSWRHKVDLAARPWMLHALKRMRFLRTVLPGWHAKEQKYRDDYLQRLAEFKVQPESRDYKTAMTIISSARCQNCLNPECKESGCPLGNRIPEWIDLAYQGKWRQASDLLHETNNFPEFTASICPAPCQQTCKERLNEFPVQIRQIESDIVERAFANDWVVPQQAPARTGRRVAVVGSGPAGLTVAQQLARLGHDVVIFEKDAEAGGLLRWGIPDFRLSKDKVDRRIRQLQDEGVTFRTGVEIGRDVAGRQLRAEFDAVCLAAGAAKPRNLDVPGRQHEGIHFAMDYLRQENDRVAGRHNEPEASLNARGKTVAVIGGGETGNDCVETALLQGAREVHQLEILPDSAVSADPTHEPPPGIQRHWSVATKAFEGNGPGLQALVAHRVRWVNTANGPRMVDQPDGTFTLKADMALLALGFEAEATPLAEQFGTETDDRGRIVLRGATTTAPGVFAAGDFAEGASLVVRAIASGRQAAAEIHSYLREM